MHTRVMCVRLTNACARGVCVVCDGRTCERAQVDTALQAVQLLDGGEDHLQLLQVLQLVLAGDGALVDMVVVRRLVMLVSMMMTALSNMCWWVMW